MDVATRLSVDHAKPSTAASMVGRGLARMATSGRAKPAARHDGPGRSWCAYRGPARTPPRRRAPLETRPQPLAVTPPVPSVRRLLSLAWPVVIHRAAQAV